MVLLHFCMEIYGIICQLLPLIFAIVAESFGGNLFWIFSQTVSMESRIF